MLRQFVKILQEDMRMATTKMDLTGLKCPQPAMKIASIIMSMKPGDIIEADADCDTFEADVRGVCARWKKTILGFKMKTPTVKSVMIQI